MRRVPSILLLGIVAAVALVAPQQSRAAARGYELVTPPGSASYPTQFIAAQPTGNGVYWASGFGTDDPAPEDAGSIDIFFAHREAGGWATDWISRWDMSPGETVPFGVDFATVGMTTVGAVFSTQAGIDPRDHNHPPLTAAGDDLYRTLGATGPAGLLTAPPGQPTGPNGWITNGGPNFYAFTSTPDLATTVFATSDPLLPSDTDSAWDVYLSRDGGLQLLSRQVDGSADNSAADAHLGAPNVGVGGIGRSGFPVSQGIDPVSEDGTAVVFRTAAPLDPAHDQDTSTDLYLWKNGVVSLISGSARTVPQCPSGCAADATFVGMASDGSTIYFSTTEQLTNDDHDTGQDIYSYAPSRTPQLVLATDGDHDGVVYPVSVSRDGSKLFFLSADRLGSDAPAGTAPVIYRWDGTNIRTVGALASTDITNPGITGANVVHYNGANRSARETADGAALAFVTSARLDPERDHDSASDVYLWREDGSLRLVSDGGTEDVPAQLGATPGLDAAMATGGGRGINADASRVFFSSTEKLTADAGDNGRSKVYEWDERSGVQLVSPAGVEAEAATYTDNDASGRSVFFQTRQSLVGADQDGDETDVYDARIGGGFPESSVSECDGDGCRGPLPAPPAPARIGSTSVVGDGNVVSPPRRTRPTVRVSRAKSYAGPTASLRVRVSDAGRIVISGPRVRRVRRSAGRAATYRVAVRLTPRGVRGLRARGTIRARVRVTFRPAEGRAVSKVITVRFKHSKRVRMHENSKRAGRHARRAASIARLHADAGKGGR